MKFMDIAVEEALIPNIKAEDKNEAIEELADLLVNAGAIEASDKDDIIQAVLTREAQATTGIGKGIALPHAKVKSVRRPLCAIGCSKEGIDFAALDAKPVYSVILLLSNPDNPDEHLQAMETIFKHVQRDVFRKFLRQSETHEAMVDLIREADELG